MLSFLLASLCVITSLPPSISICLPCVKELCSDSSRNCTLVPAFNCPAVNNCIAGVVKDECGCCDICAKTIGEKCHEEPASLEWQGRCATGLKCVLSEEGSADMFKGLDYVSNYTVNRCEKATQECIDPVTGRSYRAGSLWSDDNFACVTCMCSKDGQLRCSKITCNSPVCEDIARVEGRCCSFCNKKDWDSGCRFNGETYFNHEAIVLPDYHTVCKCQESKWSCTSDMHRHFFPLTERPLCANGINDEPLKTGEIWRPSDCAQCVCGDNRHGNCSSIMCPPTACDFPIKLRNRCCQICPRDYLRACYYNKQKYLPGEMVALPDRCTLCTCENTGWRCSNTFCKDLNYIREPISFK